MSHENRSIGRRTYIKGMGAASVVATTGLAGCTILGDNGGGGDTLTIAGTVPETGDFSSLGQDLRRGYELGVQRMEENLDRDVDLILRDDESNEQTLREQLQQITSNNDVNMIWGSFSSLLVTAGSAYAENNDLPFLGIAFAYEGPHRNEGYEWTFAPFPKSRDVARSTQGVLELIPESERPTNIGIWEPNSGWGEEQADYWEETLSDDYEIVLREQFEIGAQDFSTLISQSQSADVEVLLSNPTPGGGITSITQMRENNWSPQLLKYVRGADSSGWWSGLEQDGAYALMCPGWVPGLTGGGNETMRQAYTEEYDDDSEYLPVNVGGSYNLTQVAHQAVQAAGSTEAEEIRNTLRDEEFETVIGTFSFEDNGLPAEGELTAPTGQWWEGAQRTVYPDTDSEQALDLQYPLPAWDDR